MVKRATKRKTRKRRDIFDIIKDNVKISKYSKKYKNELIKYLNKIQKAKPFTSLSIEVIPKKNRTWGYTYRAYTNKGYVSPVASGIGYDKKSKALSYALNNDYSLMKYVYKKRYNSKNRNKSLKDYMFGYGLSEWDSKILNFEGGVGYETLINSLKKLGLKVDYYNLRNGALVVNIKRGK